MTAQTKSVRAGKTEAEPEIRKVTLRGVTYVIRELDVVEYKKCLEAATKNGFTPFQDLLDQMVIMAIKPSPATAKRPLPYPVYRTLEDIVNVMHFVNLEDEADKPDDDKKDDVESDEEAKDEPDPNS